MLEKLRGFMKVTGQLRTTVGLAAVLEFYNFQPGTEAQ